MVKEIITFLLNPLLNQRGQMLGTFPYEGNAMAPGNEEETRSYERFLTSEPSADYGDLISKYKDMYAGGAGSYDAYQQMQTSQDLERIRNTQAARGLGGRSGVGVAAASQYMSQAGPRHTMQKADYMGKLMSDYAQAVSSGRKGYSLAQTKAMAKRGPTPTTGGQQGSSPFQYLSSSGAPMGGGGGGSAPGGSGSGGSGGGFFDSHPTGGTVETWLQGGPSGGPNFYGPADDPTGARGGYFSGYGEANAPMDFDIGGGQMRYGLSREKQMAPGWNL